MSHIYFDLERYCDYKIMISLGFIRFLDRLKNLFNNNAK